MIHEIKRPTYLRQLVSGQDNRMVKIITGIRRCGKSYLLFNLFYRHLLDSGIKEDHIIRISLDNILNEDLLNPKALMQHILNMVQDKDIYYVLLDEVQMVERFVSAILSIMQIKNVNLYVTGSNSKFLSTDIATEFRGRGQEIHMYPLSFKEYLSASGQTPAEAWQTYYVFGGLPQVAFLNGNKEKSDYLQNLYSTVYIRDIIERNNLRKEGALDTLMKILASQIGCPCNPSKLSNTFKSIDKTYISSETISSYLKCASDAFLIEKADRFDVKGKKYIGTLSKIYFTDLGVRNAILNFRQNEETHIMENIIYNELKILGMKVDVGMVETREAVKGKNSTQRYEVDFVVEYESVRYYIQSALQIPNREKEEQETASLIRIKDSFKKIIVVKDEIIPWWNENGILIIGLFDFLLTPEKWM